MKKARRRGEGVSQSLEVKKMPIISLISKGNTYTDASYPH
jgi:hypothetical protein